MLFKGCGVVIHLCKQCGRVLTLLFKSSLMISGHRLRTVWRDVEELNPQDTNSKLATYQYIFAVPFDLNVRVPFRLPRHLQLDLSPLQAEGAHPHSVAWDLLCDHCACEQI